MGQRKKKQNWFTSWVIPIVIGVAVAFGLRTWVLGDARVPSSSMYPTIPGVSDANFAMIVDNKMATEFRPIHRGEVVVFHWPDDPSQLFVKRVIGLPRDTVKVTESSVYINGDKLDESNPNIAKSNGVALGTYQVPAGHYFMMGDNRTVSDDSRSWVHKYVARSAIVGQADFVFCPLNRMAQISQSLSAPNRGQ